jgi:hypothetical protein
MPVHDFQGHQTCRDGKESAKTSPGSPESRVIADIGRKSSTTEDTEEEASEDFAAKGAEVAKKEEQRGLVTATPRSREKALPQRTQRNTEEEASEDFTAKGAEVAKKDSPEDGAGSRIEDRSEPQNAEGIPGVESAKSIFFGVEPGEGVADNRPVSPPSEPPRKSSQREVLVIPKDVEHHAGR